MANGNDYLRHMMKQNRQKKKEPDQLALFKTIAVMAGIIVVLFLAAESGRFGW